MNDEEKTQPESEAVPDDDLLAWLISSTTKGGLISPEEAEGYSPENGIIISKV